MQRHAVLAQVNAVLFLEFINQPVHDALINVIAAQVRIAVGGLHLDHAAAHFQHGNVERAATQVVHRDGFIALFVQPIRQRGRCRLVNNAHHFHARDFAGLLGGLALRVVEVRRHGNHGLADLFAKEVFRSRFQLRQNHGGNFRRAVKLTGDFDTRVIMRTFHNFIGHAAHLFADFVIAPAHEALDRIHGVLGVRHRLSLGYLPNEPLSRLSDGHNRRCRPGAFLVGDDHRFAALHHGDNRVRRPKVNSNNLAHNCSASSNCLPLPMALL